MHTAKVFSPADLRFAGSLTVKKVMMDARKGVYHDEIDKNKVKLIRENYRWLNSNKRKDFAELEASQVLESLKRTNDKLEISDHENTEMKDANSLTSDLGEEVLAEPKRCNSEKVGKNSRKRGPYKSFDELGLKQRKRRTNDLFVISETDSC